MFGSTDFIDEIDCGSFFDDLFPNCDVELEASDSTAINAAAFPSIWAAHPESLPCSDSVFFRKSASESDLSAELFVPYENIVQLEWMSKFVEDSHCGASLPMKKEESSSINKASHHQFQTCSPVSVLESSSSSSGAKQLPRSPEAAAPGKRGRPRSKRPRPATLNHLPGAQLISPTSSVNENDIPQPLAVPKVPSDSENYAESRLLIKLPKQVNPEHKKKQKKIKLSLSAPAPLADHNSENPTGQAVRKCTHCEITKTPQWRAGPLGPKTLCNACGVRHKSGRLFPEYRPAASPTFIPSLHSNSHKKVVEMRAKSCTAPMAAKNSLPELVPNKSNPALDYI